jgi:UTP--glucose-1-phosphate uridylyltransferase
MIVRRKLMNRVAEKFDPFAERMQDEGLPGVVVRTFRDQYTQLVKGRQGFIREADIQPVSSLPDVESFPADLATIGETALSKTIMLKLNGGLGTSMGLDQAKSLLAVKDDMSFLDIVARQALKLDIRLMLMNSFATRRDSLAVLKQYPALRNGIPLDFLQHKIPKVTRDDLTPAEWPRDPSLEWCPPGHGDIYTALITSGALDELLEAGFEYAFVSNIDNLGAVLDSAILGYFVKHQLAFLMEATDRTEADKKGGHLARLPSGQLILRESAQCHPDEIEAFQDTSRYKYFNTNNLWLNLRSLDAMMNAKDTPLRLPLILNRKRVDPRDSHSTPVYQLETAMGAAISVFDEGTAVRVPRTRFAPIKTTEDLLAVRSDAFVLTDDFRVTPNPDRELGPILISLDPKYYRRIDDMEARFPWDVPSLVECETLSIAGDIRFGRDISLRGNVQLENRSGRQVTIDDGASLSGQLTW